LLLFVVVAGRIFLKRGEDIIDAEVEKDILAGEKSFKKA